MKQFSLEEFKKNPTRKVVTRDGKQVRIICTNSKSNHPIVGLIRQYNSLEATCNFKEDGTVLEHGENVRDLFFAPEKIDGWVNVYKQSEDYIRTGCTVFKTKEEAMKSINGAFYVATIHIEWEEE